MKVQAIKTVAPQPVKTASQPLKPLSEDKKEPKPEAPVGTGTTDNTDKKTTTHQWIA